jgi:hypothetical protein
VLATDKLVYNNLLAIIEMLEWRGKSLYKILEEPEKIAETLFWVGQYRFAYLFYYNKWLSSCSTDLLWKIYVYLILEGFLLSDEDSMHTDVGELAFEVETKNMERFHGL